MSSTVTESEAKMQIGIRKILMATLYGAGGAFFTFRPVFLSTAVTAEQVGTMLFIGSVLTTITNPIISAVADSMQAQRALMMLSAGGQAACQLAMLMPGLGYRGLLVLVTLHKLIGEHAFPILDASTVVACGEHFGPIRLFGAVGFGAAAFGGGGLISLSGSPNARSNFVTAFAFASAMQLVSLPLIARLDFSALQVRRRSLSQLAPAFCLLSNWLRARTARRFPPPPLRPTAARKASPPKQQLLAGSRHFSRSRARPRCSSSS
jgi:hypothetical protein